MYKKFIFAVVLFFGLAFSVSALVLHNYICADWSFGGGGSCTSDTLNLNGAGSEGTGSGFNLSNSTTYYVSYTAVGSGNIRVSLRGNSTNSAEPNLSGSQTDYSLTTGAGNSTIYLNFYDNNSFSGTLSNICITDTVGACTPTPSPSITAATTTVDTAVGTLYNGIVLFMVGFYGMIWFFRKR